jgi:AcrR family transcriptional regulator
MTEGKAAARDRKGTEAKLREAAGTLLTRSGFSALGMSAIAQEAGVDKKLIYRYFGSLEGLVTALVESPGFWPTFEELCGGDIEAMRALPLPKRLGELMHNYACALMRRPVALEMMAWETSERNPVTAITEVARERLNEKLVATLFDDFSQPREILGAAAAIIGGAINYLVIRRRKVRFFSGIDLRSDEGWRHLIRAIEVMAEPFAAKVMDEHALANESKAVTAGR